MSGPVIPSTQALNDRIIDQLEGSLGQTIPILPKAFARVLAKVLAGVFVLLYRYGGFIFLQLFVAHATMAETTVSGKTIRPLVELGRLFGVGDPFDATRAQLSCTVPVLTQVGNLAAGQKLIRTETGIVYEVVASVPLNAPTVTFTMRAIGDPDGNGGVGDIGNLQPGDKVSFASAPATISSEATVVAQVVTAADAESPERYRIRILGHVQARPQGGAYADYREWSEEVPGIVHAYPYAGLPGQVDIYVEADEASSGSPDGVPTDPQLTAVFNSIQLNAADSGKATRRPVSAAVNVRAITRRAFDVRISALSPDTPDTRAALVEGLDEHLRSLEPFIVGLSVLPRKDRVTQAALSGIVDTIVSANGATISKVELLVSGFPVSAYTLLAGEKAKLNQPILYV